MQAQYFHYNILEVYNLTELENYQNHRRLKVFYNKGCKCVECGVEGTILALGKDKWGNLHLDIYTNNFYPLTVDHIIPKSKGGSNELDNLQPMCCLCNWGKGNGDRPANIGNRKYKYSQDIPLRKELSKPIEQYVKDNLREGDIIFKNIGIKKI